MNSFGRLFTVTIFGESHGSCVGVVVGGCPAGIPLSETDFSAHLERRRSGRTGTTGRREPDIPLLKSGIFNGLTTGAPVLILFANTDTDSSPYEEIRFTPRPGQADFVAYEKYGGLNDYRGGGHFSGRLTVGIVAAGVVAKKLIHPVKIEAELLEAGGSTEIEGAVRSAMERRDSVGGLVECRVTGLPVGLGEPFFDSVEALISHMVFSIPGVKGMEFGAGFGGSRMRGSEFNDEILDREGRTRTNNAGGVNGGITNGNEVCFRVAVRPTATILIPQQTVDMRTGGSVVLEVAGRHDVCIALRMPVIVEAAAAIVFADLMLLEQRIGRVRREREWT
jgi:chorismate synthase